MIKLWELISSQRGKSVGKGEKPKTGNLGKTGNMKKQMGTTNISRDGHHKKNQREMLEIQNTVSEMRIPSMGSGGGYSQGRNL